MDLRQIIAAGAGGAAGTAVDVTTLVLLVHHRTPVALAAFVASAAGAVVCFLANKYLAFRDRSPVTVAQIGRFAGVALATALLMAAAMQLFAVQLGLPYLLAKMICAAGVFAAWTYPAQRRLVFRPVALSVDPQPSMSLS